MEFKKRPFKRHERLNKEIKIILSDFILKGLDSPECGIVTISKVNVSRDLSNAKIYYTVINNLSSKEEISNILNKKSKFLKGIIGKQITSKHIPNITFYFDDSIEMYEKIDKMFLKINDR